LHLENEAVPIIPYTETIRYSSPGVCVVPEECEADPNIPDVWIDPLQAERERIARAMEFQIRVENDEKHAEWCHAWIERIRANDFDDFEPVMAVAGTNGVTAAPEEW
jgi:hypothetical protein